MKIIRWLLITVITALNYAVCPMVNAHVKEVVRYTNLNLSNTQIRYMVSNFTHKGYKIYVNIPADYYQHPEKTYPALFLLDADYSFPIAKAIIEHLEDRNRIDDVFIFGIAYDGPLQYELNRTRDYTPSFVAHDGYGSKYQNVSGGGPKFKQFLKKELIPYLSQSFRLSNSRTLVGHSYGGLFASWLMLKNPEIFSRYIIVSPSLWYNHYQIFQLVKKSLNHQKSASLKVFFGIGEKENGGTHTMVDDMNTFIKTLKQGDFKNDPIQSIIFPHEDHDTIFPTALTQGILYLYKKT